MSISRKCIRKNVPEKSEEFRADTTPCLSTENEEQSSSRQAAIDNSDQPVRAHRLIRIAIGR